MSSEFQSRVKNLCPAYSEFLAQHASEVFVGPVILLYGRAEIEERNATHKVDLYLPNYVAIGNDSGDYEFLLQRDGSENVFWEDPGAFSAPSLEMIHPSFPRWLADGCPLPESPECPIPLQGQIWLHAKPLGGIKDMFHINKALVLNWSIPQMKQSLVAMPALLIPQGMPFRVHRILAKHPDLRPLLGFSQPDGAIRAFADFKSDDFALPRRP